MKILFSYISPPSEVPLFHQPLQLFLNTSLSCSCWSTGPGLSGICSSNPLSFSLFYLIQSYLKLVFFFFSKFLKNYLKFFSYYFIVCQLLWKVPENCKVANFLYFEFHNFICVLTCIVCFLNVCLVVFNRSFILFQQEEFWVTHKHSFGYYYNWLHVQLTSLSASRF